MREKKQAKNGFRFKKKSAFACLFFVTNQKRVTLAVKSDITCKYQKQAKQKSRLSVNYIHTKKKHKLA